MLWNVSGPEPARSKIKLHLRDDAVSAHSSSTTPAIQRITSRHPQLKYIVFKPVQRFNVFPSLYIVLRLYIFSSSAFASAKPCSRKWQERSRPVCRIRNTISHSYRKCQWVKTNIRAKSCTVFCLQYCCTVRSSTGDLNDQAKHNDKPVVPTLSTRNLLVGGIY